MEQQLADYQNVKSKMEEILNDKIAFKIKYEDQCERLQLFAGENQVLKEHTAELEEDLK